MKRTALAVLLFLLAQAGYSVTPQSTAFTYQGNLSQNSLPASGYFDLTFSLFNDATVGSQVGTTISMPSFYIPNGTFTTDLDFPGVFTGNQLWLEVTVGAETLSPRQPVNAAPIAQFALKGNTIASAWSSSASYAQGALVTGGGTGKTLFMALQANTNKTPGDPGNEAFWTGVSTGTGAAPIGIPYTMLTHQASGSQFYGATTPAARPYSGTLNPDVMTYIPTDCTPSLSVYSLTGDSTAVTFYVTTLPAVAGGFSTGGGGTLGNPCSLTSTSTSVPATCSATGMGTGSPISAGSFATIWAFGTTETGTIFTAFSCY
jgi:hypothetical protein